MSAWKKLLAAEGPPAPPPAAEDPWAVAEQQTRPASLHEGFEDGRRARRGAGWWTWAKRIAVGVLLLAGFIQLVVKPVRNVLADDTPAREDTAPVSLQAAGATATGFALDYLSSGGTTAAGQRAAALEHWLYPGAFSEAADVGSWGGDAVLLADSATVQDTARVGSDAAVLAVQVRVRTFTPAGTGTKPPAPAAPQKGGSAAFSPQVPAGYSAGPAYWLRLLVPVMRSGSAVLVTAPGPVFSGDAPTPVPVTVESDAAENEVLLGPATKILQAYAAGDLQYVAAPGADLAGLDGAFSVAGVSNVRVATAGKEDASRTLAADVEWTLAGTTATVTQTYGLRLRGAGSSAPQLEHIGVLEPTRPDK
ncbi:conjugal transfer protein [Cumulibacter manganitolerans]|uniref:conjugal transfer protein n=1 Tax=Cumulibacter manganitolerans TaxID=1884992 RepID=UPI001295EEF6|nr:conjugal transfer protein [Cumulibacter manganitolerans]